MSTFHRPLAILAFATLLIAPAARAETTSEFIELTALADELAFDIRQNRDLMLELCSASEWCRVYGQELIAAIEDSGTTLRLGALAVPMVEEMLELMDPEPKVALFEFYRSDLGRKIVDIEIDSRTDAFLERVELEGAEYYASIADEEERYMLAESIDSESDRSATARLIHGTAQRVVDFVAQRARDRGETAQPVKLELKSRDRHAYHLRLAFTLKDLTTEEGEAFIEFLESDAGQQWSQTKREVRVRAAREASKPIINRLVNELGSAPSN
ncbi:MAG: hypothetical protein AAGM22_27450 [Acidobacteriota bacterium]